MRTILFILFTFFFVLVDAARAYEIIVFINNRSKTSEIIQQVFLREINRKVPHRGLKAVQPHQIREVVLSEADPAGIASQIKHTGPDLILAIGTRALRAAVTVPSVPVIHLLAVNPERITGGLAMVGGVNMSVAPHEQLAEIQRVLPGVKRIGIVYDPSRSRGFVEQLLVAGPGMEFITLAAGKSSEVPGLIASLQGKIDLLWMLPDLTATNQKTIQSYILFSIRNKIPLLTFSGKLLKQGATLAITFDLDGISGQAADLAAKMLHPGPETTAGELINPAVKTVVNRNVSKKLGISIATEGELRD